ncbi:glutamine-dependent NAD(+) synthetase-like [Salvelinus sp. IW2-2015]|uniref:glutamine-dependent NAD(+) synthetase-like n=1 Tax=Salvelinus sp. IW2-2015 TaxID=2691554 RepID=UPI0038D49905
MGLDGVEIFTNSSASHHELRKSGGVYMFANQKGCDGARLYYDGCAMVAINDDTVAQGRKFSLDDLGELCLITWHAKRLCPSGLGDVRSYRGEHCHPHVEYEHKPGHRDQVDFSRSDCEDVYLPTHQPIEWQFHTPEKEIGLGPACCLWYCLRRSGQMSSSIFGLNDV